MVVALMAPGGVLPGRFEVSSELLGKRQHVLPIRHHAWSRDSALLVAQLESGTACWAADGRLLGAWPRGIDLAVSRDGVSLWCLEFDPGKRKQHERHLLKKLAMGSWQHEVEFDVALPQGLANGLLLDESRDLAIITWADQTETGYLAFSLRDGAPRAFRFDRHATTFERPVLLEKRALVAACHGFPTWGEELRLCWWNDSADDPFEPSPGGVRTVAWLTTHSLEMAEPVEHALRVVTEAGWVPGDAESPSANAVRGPVAIDDHTLRIWLPDQREHDIRLPLTGGDLVFEP